MTDDLDLYRAAKLLIDQRGADGGLHAAERADQLLEAGDMIGAAAWRAASPEVLRVPDSASSSLLTNC